LAEAKVVGSLGPDGRLKFLSARIGSWYEDTGLRSVNHFFNPVNNRALSPVFYTSPSWALEDQGSAIGQSYSYADARKYYWQALTNADATTRNTDFGLTFQILGQVVHHIEDMAQPQHARDEAHCSSIGWCRWPGPLNQYHPSMYEGYVFDCTIFQYLVILGYATTSTPGFPCPAVFNAATYPLGAMVSVNDANNAFNFNDPANGVTNIKYFPSPRSFWTTSTTGGNNGAFGFGMAEYANAGFVGVHTNLTGSLTNIQPSNAAPANSLPSPNGNGALVNVLPMSDPRILGNLAPANGPTMSFIGTPITDYFAPYLSVAAPDSLTSTFSIYSFYLDQAQLPQVFSYNRVNANAAASLLIPRVISYSAGLLNYFFRGNIGIGLPHEGVYSILDHASQYGPNSSTDPTSKTAGFTQIKVNLWNASADQEPMTKGTLAAIVRFRRNLNYVDDLSQEPGSQGVSWLVGSPAVRGSTDEVILAPAVYDGTGTNLIAPNSVSLNLPPSGQSGSSVGQEFIFVLNQPLPINSTDVRVEIVWQGTLGAESNAVVSTTLDISEPSYLALFNSLDYISIGGQIVDRPTLAGSQSLLALVQPASCVINDGGELSLVASCFSSTATALLSYDASNAQQASTNLIYSPQLPAATYSRVILLTDPNNGTTLKNSSFCNVGAPTVTIDGLVNALLIDNVDYTTSPPSTTLLEDTSEITSFRGINGWTWQSCVWDGDGSGKVTGDTSKMSVLTGNSIYPVAVPSLPNNFPEN
jgi:hypothetical protein